MTRAPGFSSYSIRAAILTLLGERGPDKTICPSEAARHLAGKDEKVWRQLMKPVREVSVSMAKEGIIDIRRKGRTVDPGDFRGVYRLGFPRAGNSGGDGETGA